MSADLVRFVEARIAEDEAAAWRWCADAGGGDLDPLEDRVLRQCEAFRRIVALHRPMTSARGFLPNCEGCWEEGGEDGAPLYPCRTARYVASVWADHPDYDEEWRA